MNKRNHGKRKGSSLLDEVLEHRVLWYALAAGATLASVSAAQAKVVYTPSNVLLTPGIRRPNFLQIDLDNDGTIDFVLSDVHDYGSTSQGVALSARPARPSNAMLASGKFAAALEAGALIGNSVVFAPGSENMAYRGTFGRNYFQAGPFLNVTNRFLGVRFLISGEPHYGWIGFRSVGFRSANGFNLTARLFGWAYETDSGQPIFAGAKADDGSATLRFAEPTSLELLARGHTAIADRRRRVAA